MLNVVVLRGTLARPVHTRPLTSGSVLARLEVRTQTSAGPAETVPVVWFDPPAWLPALDAGVDLVVVGRVRRRFFAAGGITRSSTEVVADQIVRAAMRQRATQALVEVAATIESAAADAAG